MQAEDAFSKLQNQVNNIISDEDLLQEGETIIDKIIPEEEKIKIEEIPLAKIEEEKPLERQKSIKTRPKINPKKFQAA